MARKCSTWTNELNFLPPISMRQREEVSEEAACDDLLLLLGLWWGVTGACRVPCTGGGGGGGSSWCGEVSGSGRENEHHFSNSTPVRCQSHTAGKQPFIPEPRTIDLFIPVPSLSLAVSHSLTPASLPRALFDTSHPSPSTPSYYASSALLFLSRSQLWLGNPSIHPRTHAHTHTSNPHPLFLNWRILEPSAVIISP